MEPVPKSVYDERQKAIDQYLGNDRRRLDAHSESIDKLEKLTAEIAILNQQMSKITEDHEARLRTIEQVPAKRWDGVVNQIITIIIAAALGGFLSRLV